MPTRAVRDSTGAETTLAALAGGQVMVVNLWATWCTPCKAEMPTLGALQRRFEGRVRVIPVSVDEDAQAEAARSELAQLSENSLPFVMDSTRGVLFDVRAPGLPVTIIYSARGEEVARLAGGADWSSDEAAALVEAVLAGEQ